MPVRCILLASLPDLCLLIPAWACLGRFAVLGHALGQVGDGMWAVRFGRGGGSACGGSGGGGGGGGDGGGGGCKRGKSGTCGKTVAPLFLFEFGDS